MQALEERRQEVGGPAKKGCMRHKAGSNGPVATEASVADRGAPLSLDYLKVAHRTSCEPPGKYQWEQHVIAPSP